VRRIIIDDEKNERTPSPWSKSNIVLRKEPEIGMTEWVPHNFIMKNHRDMTPTQLKTKKY
jgi:hypothetical protein